MTTADINKNLTIIKLNGSERFPDETGHGYYTVKGYCFKHPVLGYYACKGDCTPYIPRGGKLALTSILQQGGFLDYNNCTWLKAV